MDDSFWSGNLIEKQHVFTAQLSVFDQDMCPCSCYYSTDYCHWLLNWSYVNNYFDSKNYWFYIEIKRFSSQSNLQVFKGYICSFFQNKPVQRMCKEIEEINCVTEEEKTAKNERENNDFDFLWALYTKWKIRAILFPYFLLTCLKKDTSVLLKVTNNWTSL